MVAGQVITGLPVTAPHFHPHDLLHGPIKAWQSRDRVGCKIATEYLAGPVVFMAWVSTYEQRGMQQVFLRRP